MVLEMGFTGTVHIRVTPEQLKTKSDEVTVAISNMERALGRLSDIMQKTSSYWQGEAGDLHRRLYSEDKEVVDEMMKRLKEHPRDLLAIAGIYQEAEQKAVELSNMLPEDIIQ